MNHKFGQQKQQYIQKTCFQKLLSGLLANKSKPLQFKEPKALFVLQLMSENNYYYGLNIFLVKNPLLYSPHSASV